MGRRIERSCGASLSSRSRENPATAHGELGEHGGHGGRVGNAVLGDGRGSADLDAEVALAERAQSILVGHIVSREEHGIDAEPLTKDAQTVALRRVAHGELDDVLAVAHREAGVERGCALTRGALERGRGILLDDPRVHGEPRGLVLDPRTVDRGDERGERSTEGVDSLAIGGIHRGLGRTGAEPHLEPVGAHERRVGRQLADVGETLERSPGDEGDDRLRQRSEGLERVRRLGKCTR